MCGRWLGFLASARNRLRATSSSAWNCFWSPIPCTTRTPNRRMFILAPQDPGASGGRLRPPLRRRGPEQAVQIERQAEVRLDAVAAAAEVGVDRELQERPQSGPF